MANVIEIIVRASSQGFNRASQGVVRGLGSIKKAAIAASAALAGVFTSASIKQSIDFATQIDDINRKLGATTEFLSEMQFVTQQQNVEFGTFTKALQRLGRRLAEAEQGTGVAVTALEALGIEAESLSGLNLDDRFLLIAEALSRVEDEAARVAIAFKLFDVGGVELIRVTEGGAKGIRELRDRARELGLTLDKEATTAAANFGGELTEFQSNLDGIANSLSQAVLPILNKAISGYKTLAEAVGLLNKEASELTLSQTRQELAEVQSRIETLSKALLRLDQRLRDTDSENTGLLRTRRDLYQEISDELSELYARNEELLTQEAKLTGVREKQDQALDDRIKKQKLDALEKLNAAEVEKQAADLRSQLTQQQIDAEAQLRDIRREGLSETERQRDIESEAASKTIQVYDALAKARRAQNEEDRKAALDEAKSAADRINALSSQARSQETTLALAEKAAKFQKQAIETEIALLEDSGKERDEQTQKIQEQADEIRQLKAELEKAGVTVPINLDTTEFERQLAELRRLLDEFGSGVGLPVIAGGASASGFASGGPVTGPGGTDNVPAYLSSGEFVVRRDGSNLSEALAFFAGQAQRANRTGRFQDGGIAANGDVVEIRLNISGQARSMFGDRSTARALADDFARLGRALQ